MWAQKGLGICGLQTLGYSHLRKYETDKILNQKSKLKLKILVVELSIMADLSTNTVFWHMP